VATPGYWLAEHHNIPSVVRHQPAGADPYLARHTTQLRLGSGCVMLAQPRPLAVPPISSHWCWKPRPRPIYLGIGLAPVLIRDVGAVCAAPRRDDRDIDPLPQYLTTCGDVSARGVRATADGDDYILKPSRGCQRASAVAARSSMSPRNWPR